LKNISSVYAVDQNIVSVNNSNYMEFI
jgi:hypothetical protein